VGEQALVVGGAARLAVVVEFVDEGELLEEEAALDGVVVDLVDDLAPAVGEAVGVDDRVAQGQVAGEGVAHLDGGWEAFGALVEHEGEVFAGVFSAGEEEGDGADGDDDGDDGGGEEACALGVGELAVGEQLRPAFSHELQDAHVAVVVVQDLALCGGAEELVVGGLDEGDGLVDEVPLGGGRQGRVEVSLKMVEPVEGHAGTVVQDGDHADGGLVVLLALRLAGSTRGVDDAAGGAAEALAIPARGDERRLANDA
jgi:hypothetical protein